MTSRWGPAKPRQQPSAHTEGFISTKHSLSEHSLSVFYSSGHGSRPGFLLLRDWCGVETGPNRLGSTPELEWECLGIRLFLRSAPTCCVAVKISLFPLNSRFICKVQTVASALVCPAMGTVIGGGGDRCVQIQSINVSDSWEL